MEKDAMELVDYVRIIWKRKMIVIVVTLVCVIAGGVARVRTPERPDVYRAVVTIRNGKVLAADGKTVPVHSPGNLAEYIPDMYAINDADESQYFLGAEDVEGSGMIRVVIDGPDREGAKEHLKVVVNKLIDDQNIIVEKTFEPFIVYLERLKDEAQLLHVDITRLTKECKNLEIGESGFAVFQLLHSIKNNLRDYNTDIFNYQLIVNKLEECKTKVSGRVKVKLLPVRKKKNKVLIAGVVGLAVSIFMAFSIEYIVGVVRGKGEEEKGKDKSSVSR
jgi:hypothetical protein